jgi:hypothetical protein
MRDDGGEALVITSAGGDQVEERPSSSDAGPITLYDRDRHRIWAELNAEGALVIKGQDLGPPNGWSEYEYAFTIPPAELPLVRAELDGTHDDSVLDLLVANAERIAPAVKGWLVAVGAHYEFWSRIETDDE